MARAKYPGLKRTAHADELLQDPEIDVVSITSYDNYHCEHVTKALRNGKHVFVEKPLCLLEQEVRQIRETLRSHPALRMSSNLILRMSPRFIAVREMIADGRLGRIFHVEGDYLYGRKHKITNGWRGRIDNYSVVCSGAVHLIDLLMWMTGDRVVEVSACGTDLATRETPFGGNDMVVGLLRFASGMVGKVSANFACVFPHHHAVSVFGTRGTFVNGLEQGTLYRDSQPAVVPVTAEYRGLHKGLLIGGFVESILGKGEPLVTEEEVFSTISVCLALVRAAREGQTVKVHYF